MGTYPPYVNIGIDAGIRKRHNEFVYSNMREGTSDGGAGFRYGLA